MSIPLATTTITIWRVAADPTRDPYDPKPPATAAHTGVRAVISQSRRGENAAESQEVVWFRLVCDLVDLREADTIEDEKTGEQYQVIGPRRVSGIAAVSDYTRADLRQVRGVASELRVSR